MMRSSYSIDDCQFLLKDLTGIIPFTPLLEKERLIAQGHSYSEMITPEEALSKEGKDIFLSTLRNHADALAYYVGIVSDEIHRRSGRQAVIVSLARAGSPIGALIHRYLLFKYRENIPHYSISIIRGRGIDNNALDYILSHHPQGRLTFIDGWTGKGSITKELHKAINAYNESRHRQLLPMLAVLADPACVADFAGTTQDICIPNACLNSTVSGLVSRTILNDRFIGASDFHGAIRYDECRNEDFSNMFLDIVGEHFTLTDKPLPQRPLTGRVDEVIQKIKTDFDIHDINKIKLSIGESSRALIRRIPRVLLVKHPDNPDLCFVLAMARTKGVEVRTYDTMSYECITLLK